MELEFRIDRISGTAKQCASQRAQTELSALVKVNVSFLKPARIK